MRLNLINITLAAAAIGVVLPPPGIADDWMADLTLQDSSVRIWPADDATVRQSPPDFHWPAAMADKHFQVTLEYPDGSKQRRLSSVNWLNWDEVLPEGDYRWSVAVERQGRTLPGPTRRFTVSEQAHAFVIPDMETVLDRIAVKHRPRALPDAPTLRRMLDMREPGVTLLIQRVRNAAHNEPLDKPERALAAGNSERVYAELQRTQEALFAYVANGSRSHLDLALRRVDNMCRWDPAGATGYRQADQIARGITMTLTLAYDWLYEHLDAALRDRLRAILQQRLSAMHDDLFTADRHLSRFPQDSHRNHSLTMFAAMSAIMAGELEESRWWLSRALPMALHWTSPWGGEDGGFANGTAYAHWVSGDLLIAWYLLRWSLGIDVVDKAWVRNFSRYLAYFLPPGTPAGLFGDGAERRLGEQWARFGTAYTQFAPSPLGYWYASQLNGADYSRLEMLLAAPLRLSPAPLPGDVPDAALFPSIGWVAMHSDLADPERTSVYFKSSPYGSFNHSHADQNSFVIRSGAERLAIDSGYYDDYDTPHWRDWYKQTRAHNAVTFDGGQGQQVFEQGHGLGAGRIMQFEHHREYDIVTGDAGRAYGEPVKLATRTLVYLRPSLVLIYDRLRSGTPMHWQWNIHALEKMNPGAGERLLRLDRNGQSLCVTVLSGPSVTFTQNNEFTAEPRGTDYPPQWHGTFTVTESSDSFEMLTLLTVGCTEVKAQIRQDDTAVAVRLAGYDVHFGDNVRVKRTGAPARQD